MAEPSRFALVVSSSRYAHPALKQLTAPTNDAGALEELLRDREIGDFAVRPVVDQPNWVVAQEVEAFFSRRSLNDLALFYFSGHGIKDDTGALYFATMNTDPESLLATTLSSDLVMASMRRCRSLRQVLILDCCYAGAFSNAMLAKSDGTVGIQERLEGDGAGRFVLAASDSMQIALDGTEVHGETPLSAFTRTIVEGIRGGGADQDGDGDVSIDELYDYVFREMQRNHPEQTPTITNFDKKGRVVIARNPRGVTTPPAEPPKPEPPEHESPPPQQQQQPPPPPQDEPGLFEKTARWVRQHRRLTIGVGAALLVAAIVAVVLSMLPGPSGDKWSLADLGPGGLDGQLADVAALPGGATAVAVGKTGSQSARPQVWTYDGTSWSNQPQDEVDPGTGQMHAVVSSRGAAVAVGYIVETKGNSDAMAWRESPGGRWVRSCTSKADCGGTGRQEMLAVAPASGGLLAVGRDAKSGNFDGAVWRSSDDGTSWQRIAMDDPDLAGSGAQVMNGVVEFGDMIVAVGWSGRNGAIWTSTNGGDDWTRVRSSAVFSTSGHPLQLLTVVTLTVKASPRLIAVGREYGPEGNRAAAWFSDDGERWSRATVENASFSGQQMVDVDAGRQGLVAVGNESDSRAGVWQSLDGSRWTEVSSKSFGAPSGMAGVTVLQDRTAFAVGTAIWVNQSG